MTVPAATDRGLTGVAPTARPGSARDAIGGATPRWVVEPETAEALASILKWATAEREPVVLRGGGTHAAWGRAGKDLGVVVSTARLNRIIRYEPGDLTVSVEAGITIADLNRELGRHGQWLPLDAAAPASTIGGAIATNDSGPLRHRYGPPRDQIIGVRLATADGRLAAAGGQVVKNVAGYDLSKLVAGSFGQLAGIVSATFKLAPLPAASSTVVLSFATIPAMAEAAASLAASQLDPLSLEAAALFGRESGYQVLVRFGGTPSSNAEQIAAAVAVAASAGSSGHDVLDEGRDEAVWQHVAAVRADAARAEVRFSWMPAALPVVLALLERISRELSLDVEFSGRAGVGAGAIYLSGEAAARTAAVTALRAAHDAVAHVVIVRGGGGETLDADVWGPPPASARIARALKDALDPAGILNAGRGPV